MSPKRNTDPRFSAFVRCSRLKIAAASGAPFGYADENFPENLREGLGHLSKPLPYLMQDRYTRERKLLSLKSLVLENEYLKVTVLPEYGGRIHAIYDKVLGEESLPLPILLIVGGEKRGISKGLLEKADKLIRINYSRDFGASLSSASATTIFAYEISRQNKTIK